MTTRNNAAQVAVKAAALPSATKTEARTARPAAKQKEGNMKTTANTWIPKRTIFGDDAARVLGAEEGGRHGTR